MAYDPESVLRAIDANSTAVFVCLAFALGFSFLYFGIALQMARKQRIYVEPFLGASVFFWHDLSFVLNWPEWLSVLWRSLVAQILDLRFVRYSGA